MDIVLRATVVFLFLFFVTRVVGRRELSTLEPFDFILLVIVGDLIQQGVMQSDYSLTGALIVVSTLAILSVAVSYVGFRVAPLRPLMEGLPLVLVEDGKPVDRNLRRERLTVGEVAAQARTQQIETLEDVRWAILESDGTISIIPKPR